MNTSFLCLQYNANIGDRGLCRSNACAPFRWLRSMLPYREAATFAGFSTLRVLPLIPTSTAVLPYAFKTAKMEFFDQPRLNSSRNHRSRRTLPYYPASCFSGHDHCEGTPSLDHGGAAAKPTIGARQCRLCLSSCSLIPPCAAKTSHPASQHPYMPPHFTPTSSPPIPLHPIAISVLAINSLSRACRWASSQQPLRIKRPPHSLNPLH